ncbi:tetratricopeptide repeat protein [Actinoplanes hulinensis]|uniref:Tetratricopeptide repeat protein n=1 Tax=Actinoplanes hulinensis TaxID=1144547 RepID=A0ABS7BEH4_9ACTN|nr:tetratricopeptide repeat protein [Actinoplanes hulinensis]MBW6439265.1 tetratricopeptide repeat protein [Actinoplanes hulinensis]
MDPLDELRAEAGHDPEARADLARELSNRSLTLGEQDRADEALTFAGEAVMHYRHLVAQSAEDPDHSRHLAQALSNWALALGRLERHDEAHAALTEAVAIHRTSADDGPGRQHLAIALTNLAHNHTEQRSWEDAIAPAWEAVALLRGLLQTGEGDDTTLGHLGAALTNWSNALRAADRGDEANEKLTEALQVAREHSGPASLVQYAQLLHNLGVDRGDDGAVDEAVTLLSEAESLLAAAAESEPGYRWMAAQTGYALGLRLAEAERPQPARDAFDRVVRWRRQLVADDPDRYQIDLARALRQLSCMHESLADDAGQIGDRQAHAAAALTAQAEAVTLMRDLTSREPQRRAEFADTLRDYADLLDTADRHADAAAARAEAER